MDTKTIRSKSLSEALDDELLETIDEELELEFDDQRLDSVLGPIAPAVAREEALDRRTYFRELLRLQRELIKLQDWVVHQKLKLVVLFEGRDAAGKGGVIKRITQRLNPRVCKVVALSNASWDSAPRRTARSFSAPCRNSKGCWFVPGSFS
jgi:polyphosphate kinase 2 (PPK2 family)